MCHELMLVHLTNDTLSIPLNVRRCILVTTTRIHFLINV